MLEAMKKRYMAPEATNVELALSPVMTTVSGETGNVGTGDGTAGDNTPDLSAGNRGDWGNLWK